MDRWQLLHVSLTLLSALHGVEFVVGEIFDVTTIYKLGDDNDNSMGEIHARTNALGLPFTVDGELIEPVTSTIPKCDSLKNGVKACNWTISGWKWIQNNSPLLFPEGGVLHSFSPLTQKTDAHFIDLETLLVLNLKGNSERSITIWLLPEQNLVREQDNFYFIEILWADDWWFKRKMRFGKSCHTTATYEDKYDKSFIDIDLKITNIICDETVEIETDWSNSRYFNEYIVIEVHNSELSVWGDSAMSKKLISYTKPGMSLNYALILPRIYDISASYTKAKSLMLSEESGSITSPWISLYSEKVCIVLVYKSQKLTMRSIPELWLEIRDSHGQAAVLGTFHTKDDGWRSERIVAIVPQNIQQENVTLVINGVNNFAHIEVERIAGCNSEEEEDIALFPVRNGTMKSYSVALASESVPLTDNRTDCMNGGIGYGKKCICPPGFSGKDCKKGCGPNRFGADCGGKCSTTTDECRGLLLCYHLVGCYCAPGYHGDFCTEPCNYGQYGPNCSQTCVMCTSACDVYTGECSACVPGFIPPFCNKTIRYKPNWKPELMLDCSAEQEDINQKQVYPYTKLPPKVTVTEAGKASILPDLTELDGEGEPTSYAIQYKIKGEETWKLISHYDIIKSDDDSKSTTSLMETVVEGLQIGKLYETRIVLYTNKGNSYEGDKIPVAEFFAFCNVPQNVSYSLDTVIGDSWFAVTWSYNGGEQSCPVLYYQVLWKKAWKWFINETTDTMWNITESITGNYKFKVRAYTTQGFANFETFIPSMLKVAERVKNLHVLNITATSITLSWHLPGRNKSDNPEFCIKAECLKRVLCESGCANISVNQYITLENSFTLTDLLPFTQYSVSVCVIRNSEQGPHTTVGITTNESMPTEVPKLSDMTPVRSNNNVVVHWSPVPVCTSKFISYVYRVINQKNDAEELFSGETSNTNITIENLSPNVAYKVHVSIKTEHGLNPNKYLEILVDKVHPMKPLSDRLLYQDNKNLMSDDEVLLNLPVPIEDYWESTGNQLTPSSNSENQSFTDLAVRRLNKPLNSDRISLFGRHNKLNNEVTKLPVLNMVTENYQNLLNEQTTGTVPTVNQSATRSETLNVLSSEKLLTAKSVSPDHSLHEVTNLTVYKQSKNLLGIRWAIPQEGATELKYEIKYNLDSVNWRDEILPDKCVPWPQFYCHIITPLQANKKYTIEVTPKSMKTMQVGQPVSVTGRTAEDAPGPVANLTVVERLSTAISLQWKHPYFSNGIIRSFTVGTEQTSDFKDDNNFKSYPAKMIDAAVEKLQYVVQITNLAPASTYLISVTAKTIQPGPAKSVEVHTPPPPLEITVKPLIVISSSDDWTWLPQVSTTYDFENYQPLIKGNMLIVLGNETIPERCNQPLWINDLNIQIRSTLGNNFRIVAENFKDNTLVIGSRERYDGRWGAICNDPFTPNGMYKLVIVQVTEYKETYSLDYKFSTLFEASANNNFL